MGPLWLSVPMEDEWSTLTCGLSPSDRAASLWAGVTLGLDDGLIVNYDLGLDPYGTVLDPPRVSSEPPAMGGLVPPCAQAIMKGPRFP